MQDKINYKRLKWFVKQQWHSTKCLILYTLFCLLDVVLQTILDIYIYICVCLWVYVCLWHVSMRIFNLFMIPLRKNRLWAFVTDINNQLAWKCIKIPAIWSSALTWLAGLLTMHFYLKLTEDQVRISLKRTFMYFPWFFILLSPPLLKSSQKFTFDGQMVIFLL